MIGPWKRQKLSFTISDFTRVQYLFYYGPTLEVPILALLSSVSTGVQTSPDLTRSLAFA